MIPWATPLADVGRWPCSVLLQASVVDQRLTVTLDGQPLFQPLDYENPASGPPADESPIALGVRGGSLRVRDLKIFRDVYYTSSLVRSRVILTASTNRTSSRTASTSCWATTARSPTTPGSGPPVPWCPGRCSWASRSWSIFLARSWPSRSSAVRFTGFPIRGESGTFIECEGLARRQGLPAAPGA